MHFSNLSMGKDVMKEFEETFIKTKYLFACIGMCMLTSVANTVHPG